MMQQDDSITVSSEEFRLKVLQRWVEQFEAWLQESLTSWDERDNQIGQANGVIVWTLTEGVAGFLPADFLAVVNRLVEQRWLLMRRFPSA